MDPRRDPNLPPQGWYQQPPAQLPYVPQAPPYYTPYPAYPPYPPYATYPHPIQQVPLQYTPYAYYQVPTSMVPQGMSMAITHPQPMPPIPQVPSIPQQPPAPQEQPPPATSQPAVPPETPTKLPPLPISLPPPANPLPTSTEDTKKKPNKVSYKKENGVYRCHKCERTYLSYPALYTHNKLKHPPAQGNSTGKPTNRGRPKKNGKEEEKLPNLEKLFEKDDRKGETSDPLSTFAELYSTVYGEEKKYGGSENHPVYIELKKWAEQKKFAEIMAPKRINIKEDFANKRRKKCDEVFAEYLAYAAEHSKEEYYKEVTKFVLLYRECLNLYGEKLDEEKKKLPETLSLQKVETGPAVQAGQSEYCLENNAEQMPDISNEFIAIYLPNAKCATNVEEIKELTYHLCTWLFFNGYTCSLVSLSGSGKKEEEELKDEVAKEEEIKEELVSNDNKKEEKEVMDKENKKEEVINSEGKKEEKENADGVEVNAKKDDNDKEEVRKMEENKVNEVNENKEEAKVDKENLQQ